MTSVRLLLLTLLMCFPLFSLAQFIGSNQVINNGRMRFGNGTPNTEIVTTINGVSHTLNLEEDLFYDLDEDEFVHLLQNYRVEFEVEDTTVAVIVFFDILTDRDNNTVVTSLPSGENGPLAVENKMTININGEVTEVNVDNATVNYPNVSFDNGQYSFNISL
ncbi:MAG: hypothetical protein L7U68_00725 [Flavobacteriaceae bacterium]|nr:hypothetical protein [Flavobacteriaceae bacterium]